MIFVVMGQTGEYSAHREWPVRAFTDEARARDFVLECSAIAREIYKGYEDREPYADLSGLHPHTDRVQL